MVCMQRMRGRGLCALAAAWIAVTVPVRGDILLVHPDPPATGFWSEAYTTLDDALRDAVDGDQIWIAGGTYVPGGSSPNRTSTFLIGVNGDLEIAGNFAGTETQIGQRDHINPAHETILSGLFGQDPGNPADRVFHVVWGEKGSQQNDVTYRLDALQVEYGWATGRDGDPHSRDDFTHAAPAGGGAYLKDVCAIMTLCTFRDNRAGSVGEYCAIRPGAGAAVYHDIGATSVTTTSGSSLDVFNCTFRHNEAHYDAWGGAIYTDGAGQALLAVNTVFYANRAVGGSCAINEFTYGWDANGGAIAASSPAEGMVLVNCTIVDNEAVIDPMTDMSPVALGGAIRACAADLVIRNSILFGSLTNATVAHIANTCFPGDPSTTVTWSNVEGGWPAPATSMPTRCSSPGAPAICGSRHAPPRSMRATKV